MKSITIFASQKTVLFESVSDCLRARLETCAPDAREKKLAFCATADALFLDEEILRRSFDFCRAVIGSLAAPLAVLCPAEEAEALFRGETDEKAFTEKLRTLSEAQFASGAGLIDAETPKDPIERQRLQNRYRLSVLEKLLRAGVEIPCFDGVMISPLADIGAGTEILPGTQIRRGVTVGKGCTIGPNTVLDDSAIGNGCVVNATQVYRSILEDEVKIGPFCHVRPNSRLCRGVKIGDFVEVKNSTVGAGTHASHLTYIGDSDVGENVNFGCGVVTVNYNGYGKARCVIGNNAFIGCNTNLVAPVTIGDNAYTAAGSTITDDVNENALAIARVRQVNKEGWVPAFREKKKK